jgi:hypothetical protein
MSQNIKDMLEGVEVIFNASEKVLDGMSDGERIQIKELAKTVGLMVAMEPKSVLHFVNHYVHNTELAYVTRGKNGGVIKGQRAVKPNKKATSVTSIDDATNNATDIDDL